MITMAKARTDHRLSDTSSGKLIRNSPPALAPVCSSTATTRGRQKVCVELEKGLTMYVSRSLADRVARSGLNLEFNGNARTENGRITVTSPRGTSTPPPPSPKTVTWKDKFIEAELAMATPPYPVMSPKPSPRTGLPSPKMGLRSPVGEQRDRGGTFDNGPVFTTPGGVRKSYHIKPEEKPEVPCQYPICPSKGLAGAAKICHHSDCQDGNNHRPLLLCKECDEHIHSGTDHSGHLRFDVVRRSGSALGSYNSSKSLPCTPERESKSDDDEEPESGTPSTKDSTEGLADNPPDDEVDGFCEIKNSKLRRKKAYKRRYPAEGRKPPKPPSSSSLAISHVRSRSLQDSELCDNVASRTSFSHNPLEGIDENQNISPVNNNNGGAEAAAAADEENNTMNLLHKSDSFPAAGPMKPRTMSLAGTDLNHEVELADIVHHRSPSVGHVSAETQSIRSEEGGEPEDRVGGRPMEAFGPKRLYQSREREKRQKVDHSPVGRRMGGTKGSTKAAEAIAKQRKMSLGMEVFALKYDFIEEETEYDLVPALKGRTLRDAVVQVMDRRNMAIEKVDIYLEASRTPLPLIVDCFPLGGHSLHVKVKEGEAPYKSNSVQYSTSVPSKSKAHQKRDSAFGMYIKREQSHRSTSSSSQVAQGPPVINRKTSLVRPKSVPHGLKSLKNEPHPIIHHGGEQGGLEDESQSRKTGKSLSEDLAAYDNSPHGTISKSEKSATRTQNRHKISSIFNPFSGKNQEKLETLNAYLNQYSLEGLPSMPDLVVIGHRKFDETLWVTEQHWTEVVHAKYTDTMTKKQKDQQEAFWELLHTETDYIKKIKVIIDVFKCCLLNLQNDAILNEIELDKAFGNISDIYQANSEFWEDYLFKVLQHSRETGEPLNPSLAKEGFLKFDSLFMHYTKYCLEQKAMLEYIKNKHRENELFKIFVNWAEAQERCHRLQLHDLVVKPMQRLTKYKLLLKAVLKKTEQEDQRKNLMQMIDKVDKFVTEVNTVMHQKDEHERLSVIIDKLEAYDAIETPNEESKELVADYCRIDLTCPVPGCGPHQRRNLLMEGSLKLKDAYTRMDVYCFLFTDMLLVTKPNRRTDKVKVIKPPMRLDKIVVHQLRDGTSFMLAYLNEYHLATAVYTFHSETKTSGESRSWLDKIRQAQDAYQKMRNQAMDRSENRLMYLDLFEEGEDMEYAVFNSGTLPRHGSMVLDTSPEQLYRQDSGSSTDAFLPNVDMRRSQSFMDEAWLAREAEACPGDNRPRSATLGDIGRSRSPRLHLAVPSQCQHDPDMNHSPPESPNGTLRSPGHLQEVFVARPSGSRHHVPSINCHTDPEQIDSFSTGMVEPLSPVGYPAHHCQSPGLLNDENISRKLHQRRKQPGKSRFNTADAIQELKKDPKDASIKKRLSWNNGTVFIDIGEGGRGSLKDAFSSDSLRSMPSSSGVSSTGSLHLSPDSEICEETEPDTPTPGVPGHSGAGLPYSLSDHSVGTQYNSRDALPDNAPQPAVHKLSQSMMDESTSSERQTDSIALHNKALSKSVPDFCDLQLSKLSLATAGECKDGIASVEMPANGTDSASKKKMSHAQILKMKKQLLLNSTLEASEV